MADSIDAFFRQGNPYRLRFFRPRPKMVEFDPWGRSCNIECLAEEAVRVAREQRTTFRFTLEGITLEVTEKSTKESVVEEWTQRLNHEEVLSGTSD